LYSGSLVDCARVCAIHGLAAPMATSAHIDTHSASRILILAPTSSCAASSASGVKPYST
jgi:hypothetical protein